MLSNKQIISNLYRQLGELDPKLSPDSRASMLNELAYIEFLQPIKPDSWIIDRLCKLVKESLKRAEKNAGLPAKHSAGATPRDLVDQPE